MCCMPTLAIMGVLTRKRSPDCNQCALCDSLGQSAALRDYVSIPASNECQLVVLELAAMNVCAAVASLENVLARVWIDQDGSRVDQK
jgi:hypothetical protein